MTSVSRFIVDDIKSILASGFNGLLIVHLDRRGVHFDVLVIQAPRGLHVELHLYLPLIIPDRNAQAFDIMSDRDRQIDSAPLPLCRCRPADVEPVLPNSQIKAKALPAEIMNLLKLSQQGRKIPERYLVRSV